MHVIDLEIMIPASPDIIWRFLGDISVSADWQAGLSSVSFLTTQHEGKGARWRYSYAKGKDVVIEAAAWYDTLGYEYVIVDGAGYGENQGRIRLQEVSEGTLVRWTFNYESGGMLGGLRNAMRLKRKTTKQMQDSLRNLHDLVQKDSGGSSDYSARATVREAPGADERSSYQPRYPSNFVEAAPEKPDKEDSLDTLQPIAFTLDEEEPSPMLGQNDGDTKPNPVVLGGDGLLDMAWQMREIEAATEPIDSEVINIKPRIPPKIQPEKQEISHTEAPALAEPAESISIRPPDRPPDRPTESPSDRPSDNSTDRPTDRPVPVRAKRGAMDTSTLSVFEIFGLQKPSEMTEAPPDGGDALKESARAARDDDELSTRIRNLGRLFDDEFAPARESAADFANNHVPGQSASPAAGPAQAPQALHMLGMRRRTRRLPLRTRN